MTTTNFGTEGTVPEPAALAERFDAQSRLFNALLSNMTDPAYVFDPPGRFVFVNRATLALWSLPLEQAVGRSMPELGYLPDQVAQLRADIDAVVRTGRPVRGEINYVSPTGAGGVFEHQFAPVFGPDGTVTAVAGTSRDVTDCKRMEADRERVLADERAARAEAERAGQMKDEFLATLSHELRTPLNAVIGWAQILRGDAAAGAVDPGDLSQGLKTIERNARAQAQIIDDLLDMSRVISGKLRLDVQRLDPAAIVRAGIETVRPAAEAKAVRLQAVIDPAAGPIAGDQNRF